MNVIKGLILIGVVIAIGLFITILAYRRHKYIPKPTPKWDCHQGNCIRNDKDGHYKSESECTKNCQPTPTPTPTPPTPTPKWDCHQGNCIRNDKNGQYASESECNNSCQQIPIPKWDCHQGNCIRNDKDGKYTSESDCTKNCQHTPTPTPVPKWDCHQGNCIRNDNNGVYTSENDCTNNCKPPPPKWKIQLPCSCVRDDLKGIFNTKKACTDYCAGLHWEPIVGDHTDKDGWSACRAKPPVYPYDECGISERKFHCVDADGKTVIDETLCPPKPGNLQTSKVCWNTGCHWMGDCHTHTVSLAPEYIRDPMHMKPLAPFGSSEKEAREGLFKQCLPPIGF